MTVAVPTTTPAACCATSKSDALIQRFGSAANLNIRLHCLVLDGVYRHTEGEPIFNEARAPSRDELKGLLDRIIARLSKMLTGQLHVIEEEEMNYLADIDADRPLASVQAASCSYRIAFSLRHRTPCD